MGYLAVVDTSVEGSQLAGEAPIEEEGLDAACGLDLASHASVDAVKDTWHSNEYSGPVHSAS